MPSRGLGVTADHEEFTGDIPIPHTLGGFHFQFRMSQICGCHVIIAIASIAGEAHLR